MELEHIINAVLGALKEEPLRTHDVVRKLEFDIPESAVRSTVWIMLSRGLLEPTQDWKLSIKNAYAKIPMN